MSENENDTEDRGGITVQEGKGPGFNKALMGSHRNNDQV